MAAPLCERCIKYVVQSRRKRIVGMSYDLMLDFSYTFIIVNAN